MFDGNNSNASPPLKTQSWRTAFGGTALLEAASAIKGKNLQEFAFEKLDVFGGGSGQFFNGSFLAPATDDNVTSLEIGKQRYNANVKVQLFQSSTTDITFISPWTQDSDVRPYWILEDPSGNGNNNQERN